MGIPCFMMLMVQRSGDHIYIYIYTPKTYIHPKQQGHILFVCITGFWSYRNPPPFQASIPIHPGRLHITLRGCSQGIPEVGGTSTTRSMCSWHLKWRFKITGGPCYAIYVPKNKHCKHKKYIIQVDCHHFLANITAVMFAKTTPERDGFKQTLE